jgi:hypothetical protein
MKNPIKAIKAGLRVSAARTDLRRQVGKIVDGIVTGYAQKYHLNEEQAQAEVKRALQAIVAQMEG